jgi:uncharacterized protein
MADTAAPFSFAEMEPILASAREIVEAVARAFHPDVRNAWARFSLPEFLLLAERLSRDVRREALLHIPAIRAMKLSHLLWIHRQNVRYGEAAQTGWRLGFGLWRVIRAALNPLQAAGQETSGVFFERTTKVLSYRARAYATRLLILEVGRAAIDLYSGRLALSDIELRSAQERDMAGAAAAPIPVRIILIGQINAGKSSLLNALAQETRCAVGPLPTTASAAEYLLNLEGRPTLILVDMPGTDERADGASELLVQADRAAGSSHIGGHFDGTAHRGVVQWQALVKLGPCARPIADSTMTPSSARRCFHGRRSMSCTFGCVWCRLLSLCLKKSRTKIKFCHHLR